MTNPGVGSETCLNHHSSATFSIKFTIRCDKHALDFLSIPNPACGDDTCHIDASVISAIFMTANPCLQIHQPVTLTFSVSGACVKLTSSSRDSSDVTVVMAAAATPGDTQGWKGNRGVGRTRETRQTIKAASIGTVCTVASDDVRKTNV